MEPENKTKATKNTITAKSTKSNKVLFWVLGGCAVLLIIGGLVAAGLSYWGYKKAKTEIGKSKPQLEALENQMQKINEEAEKNKAQTESLYNEEPEDASSSSDGGALSANSERQMGYIKKVYLKDGKNYLDIDYIQWLTGDAAEQAMREDGECPDGDCFPLDDYYIRNQNPLVRTFEIVPEVQILMQTYTMGQEGGDIKWNQPITLDQFKGIFSSNSKPHLKNVPYIIEIQNQQIARIIEQYVP